MVTSIAVRRPRRSANRPSRNPPSGRKKNASAYVASVLISASAAFSLGKIWVAKKMLNVA
jgi:hypothetical protein